MNQETGKLRTFTLRSPIKVKFSDEEISNYATKQLGVQASSAVFCARVEALRARCDDSGYLTMDLHELMECLQQGVKTENTVGDIQMYFRNTEHPHSNLAYLNERNSCI